MSFTRGVIPPALLLAAVLVSSCDDRSPAAPSPISSPAPSATSEPASSPTPDLSQLLGVWNLTVRLTEATGEGCVAEGMQSQIGVAKHYSLLVERAGGSIVNVTLSSASGDYSCTLPNALADSGGGFTTVGRPGFFSCAGDADLRGFRCGDRTVDLISLGQDIMARISGNEISGQWVATFAYGTYLDASWADTKAEFTGRR